MWVVRKIIRAIRLNQRRAKGLLSLKMRMIFLLLHHLIIELILSCLPLIASPSTPLLPSDSYILYLVHTFLYFILTLVWMFSFGTLTHMFFCDIEPIYYPFVLIAMEVKECLNAKWYILLLFCDYKYGYDYQKTNVCS